MPEERHYHRPDVELDGDWLAFGYSGGRRVKSLEGWGFRHAPHEVYLREAREVEIGDPESVLAFTREVGCMAHPSGRSLDLPAPWRDDQAHVMLTRHWATVGSGRLDLATRPSDMHVHLAEVTFRLSLLRQMTDHAIAHERSADVRRAWLDAPTEADAWRLFVQCTSGALSRFHVRVWVPELDESADWDWGRGAPNLYELGTLQLVNDMAAGLALRVCANETCGRAFRRQLGRAEYSQHRTTGVMYCSRECARAQAERERRRRIKKAGEKAR